MRRLIASAVALLLVLLLALAVVIGAKTLATTSRQLVAAPVTPVSVDATAVADRLGAAVRLRTVSSVDDEDANADQFDALHALLQASFPKAHAVLKREVVGKHALLYTWPGRDATAPTFALMAHQDVVPIAPGTEGDWQQPPFSGVSKDGFVWGRGAWDDKGNLMAILEAVELLAATGFQPQQTLYLIAGADEEVGGERGARAVARRFAQRGVHLQFVLDEGLLITEGVLSGLTRPAALVGVAEKGSLSVQLVATGVPGHSSMPPPQAGTTAIGMLSTALGRLEAQQMPLAVGGIAREMFETLAPEMQGANRVLLSNLWLFGPVIERQLAKTASTAASLRTTTALTVVQAGNVANVLPGRASAIVNFRLLPGERSETLLEHVRQVVANPKIAVEAVPGFFEASKVARTDSSAFRLVERTLHQLHGDIVVAPGLMLGGTDSRYFDAVADTVLKFSPIRATADDLKRFHGTNERISIANHVEMIQFYHQLISNAQAAALDGPLTSPRTLP